MVDNFVFDVDGTLTPSRSTIDPKFGEWFLDFCKNNNVYLVTGSDKPKTVEQVGEEIYNAAKRVYNCSGNDTYEADQNVYTSKWILPKEAEEFLRHRCRVSGFPLRTGIHIEARKGMVNFSVVGRNATLGERKLYVSWDTAHNERVEIAKDFKQRFPEIDAVVGGDTGIDIYPVGSDKGQILRDFDKQNDFVHFFGDKMDIDGNDYPLKVKLIADAWSFSAREVKGWQDTWSHLKKYRSNNAYNVNRP